MNQEVFYLLGALRDASVDVRRGKNYEIKIYQKEKSWLDVVNDMVLNSFGISGNLHGNLLRFTNKSFVLKMLEISEMSSPQTDWKTPSIVLTASMQQKLVYIQGFWDAEGGLPENPENSNQKYISFDQKNKEAISFLRDQLCLIGFNPTNLTFTGNVWQFRLTRKKELIRFAKEIGSRHKEKGARLKRLILSLSP